MMTRVVIGSATPWDEFRFGSGAQDPYDHALRRGGGVLCLTDTAAAMSIATSVDVGRFLDDASTPERRILQYLNGPILDVGCGPGRLVKASVLAGALALGIDTSSVAIALARGKGLPVLRRSVFDPLPNEGQWGAALLIDGNIGIGGEPLALLLRCAQLVQPGGRVVVEAHEDANRDHVFSAVITDSSGHSSLPFPWAEVGTIALNRLAHRAGLIRVRQWNERQRCFAEYAKH